MTSDDKARRAQEAAGDVLAQKLTQIATAAKRRPDSAIPVLGADPPVDDPCNLWLLADGRLRSRTPDGLVHQYNEFENALPKPAVPTFATDPTVSSGWKIWYLGTPTGQLSVRLGNGNIARFNPTPAIGSMAGGSTDLPTPSSTSSVALPADEAPVRYYTVYNANEGRSFCPTHGLELTGSRIRYGNWDVAHGNQRIMLGFNDTAIRADLAGATVRQVEMRMLNTASDSPYGVQVSFGAHNAAAAPTEFSSVRKDIWSGGWPFSGMRPTSSRSSSGGLDPESWRIMPIWVGTALQSSEIKGLTVEQPDTRSRSGELDWTTVQLAITYTK